MGCLTSAGHAPLFKEGPCVYVATHAPVYSHRLIQTIGLINASTTFACVSTVDTVGGHVRWTLSVDMCPTVQAVG